MKFKFKNHYLILFLFFAGMLLAGAAQARSFNPNYIISDEEILDSNSMTLNEVRSFLARMGGYIATYSVTDLDGKTMTAAEAIYDRAVANKVNPKFLIVLLQKEQSLIEDKSPTQGQLDWACGYGCPDGSSCNTRWKGLWRQINSASLQFRDYMDNPQLYTYKKGETYTFTNPYGTISNKTIVVTPYNQATAALYNYTPHVYNGNYNFFNIWQRYFTKTLIDGSLVQAKGEVGIWLIENGLKRPFLSKGALTSRYDIKKVIQVNKSDLDSFEKGNPIKYAQYSVLRSPRGTVYLIIDDMRRGFASGEAFRQIGINPEEVIDASWDDINYYKEGEPITASSTYPTGALLQNKKTGGVYWVMNNSKAPLIDAIYLKTMFAGKSIIQVSPEELAKYTTIDPVRYADGSLLKGPQSPAVYVVSNGTKRPFLTGEVFEKFGYSWNNVMTVPQKIINLYPDGEVVREEQPESGAEASMESPQAETATNTPAASGSTQS